MATGVPFSNTPIFSKVPPFLRSAPFGELRLSRLHALLDSLGGILWLPNQHNYTLTTDTAVAPLGDPVGYMGSHRQNLPENWIKDTQFAGGTPGTPGTMPTGWLKASTGSGLSTELVSSGSGFIVVRIFGTATGTGAVDLVANTANNTVMAPAKQHQLWSGAFDVELVAGTWSASKVRGSLNEFDGSAFLVNSTAFINGAGRLIVTRALTSAACQYAYISLAYIPAVSEVVDLTLKISAPQLERGKPTAFTPTYGTAITRGTNFEPAWQDTTANKPLLGVDSDGKGILTFDGSNDFFRTGIQTPEAGYIAGVWNLTGAAGVAFGMFSSSSGAIAGARFIRSSLNVLGMFRHNGTISETCATVETYLSGKAAVDAHFAAASASVRKNGSYEVSNTNAVTATSINYFRIGASGAGGDAQTLFFNGHMLAQVWIPGTHPGATTEAEIRRLLAEITAVSGVV